MLNPSRAEKTVPTMPQAAPLDHAAAGAADKPQDAVSTWDGVAHGSHAAEERPAKRRRLEGLNKPQAHGKARPKPLMERAGHLVEDRASLVLPDLIGGLGLEAVAALARKQGLYWFRESDIDALLPELEQLRKRVHTKLDLPEAYLKGFHGFPHNANLQYLHALNMEPAIAQFAGVSLPEVGNASLARQKMLEVTCDQIKTYLGPKKSKVRKLVDVGCGTGVTTQAFGKHFGAASVTGMDASEYMLAEAQRLAKPAQRNVDWSNQLGQDTKLKAGSVDVYAMVFMAHEQKKDIMDAVLKEAYRVLKPGGVLAISDYDTERPLVKVIAHAPGVIADLASAIIFEPHLKDYLHTDFDKAGKAAGFVDFKRDKTCPNVQLLLLRKPSN